VKITKLSLVAIAAMTLTTGAMADVDDKQLFIIKQLKMVETLISLIKEIHQQMLVFN